MKNILLIGAGRSTGALVDYLNTLSSQISLFVTIVDKDKELCQKRASQISTSEAKYFDVFDKRLVYPEIEKADLVISMLPATLHFPIIRMCVDLNTDVLTASYTSDEVLELSDEAKAKNVKIVMEGGLDPGIDHMSAMEELNAIKALGGDVLSFKSYTGGLVAPESDDNPWGYKLSWNPKNVVLAGGGVTQFVRNNRYKYIPYHNLFDRVETINISGLGEFEGYANRDSLKYQELYDLHTTPTVIRGTLRKKGYCSAWSKLVKLGLTDDTCKIEHLDAMTYRDVTNSFLPYSENLSVEEKFLQRFGLDEASEDFQRVKWLGIFDREYVGLNEGTAALVLQNLLLDKWKLSDKDKDMVVMQHQFEYSLNGEIKKTLSSLVIKGVDKYDTAMSRTVGLPLGIIAKLILTEKLSNKTGVLIPTIEEFYKPVLAELESFGIEFKKEEL